VGDMLIAELNILSLWTTVIGNSYHVAHTKEMVYMIAWPELGELESRVHVINYGLYCLEHKGAHCNDIFADCIAELGCVSCKVEPDSW
jgi:hypothetical protein